MRTKYLDPDFRKDPKSDCFCARCQKDLKPGQKRRWVHCVNGGLYAIHPDDLATYIPDGADMGCFPLGLDCAKAIGLEWTMEAPR